MTRRSDYAWEIEPGSQALVAAGDAFWDDCPRHAGFGCEPLIAGSHGPEYVGLYFHARQSRAAALAAVLDAHFGQRGTLTRYPDLSRMRAQYRRKQRGWR